MFEIKYSRQAVKFLKNVDRVLARRILDRVLELRDKPVVHDSKKINNSNFFRVRVGKYRILYEIDYDSGILGVVKVDKRARVYGKI